MRCRCTTTWAQPLPWAFPCVAHTPRPQGRPAERHPAGPGWASMPKECLITGGPAMTRLQQYPRPTKGLYNDQYEHDACGVAFVADLSGRKDHGTVEKALTALRNLEHR